VPSLLLKPCTVATPSDPSSQPPDPSCRPPPAYADGFTST
jgi:hypothetical protein